MLSFRLSGRIDPRSARHDACKVVQTTEDAMHHIDNGVAMNLKSLKDLLLDQLEDIYSAEKQLTKALPKMAKSASTETLVKALNDHLAETNRQIDRLDQ